MKLRWSVVGGRWSALKLRKVLRLRCQQFVSEGSGLFDRGDRAVFGPRLLEHDPDPALIAFVEQHDLDQILSVADVQDVMLNTEDQLALIDIEDLVEALVFYYDNDAFIEWD